MTTSCSFVGISTNADIDGDATIVMTKPAGVVDGDRLFACIASYANPSAAPAGWTTLDSTSPTLYTKLASSEPASWTWTFGAVKEFVLGIVVAYRNWGNYGYNSTRSATFTDGTSTGASAGSYLGTGERNMVFSVPNTYAFDTNEPRHPYVMFAFASMDGINSPSFVQSYPYEYRGQISTNMIPSTTYAKNVGVSLAVWDLVLHRDEGEPQFLCYANGQSTSPYFKNTFYGTIGNAQNGARTRVYKAKIDSWQVVN